MCFVGFISGTHAVKVLLHIVALVKAAALSGWRTKSQRGGEVGAEIIRWVSQGQPLVSRADSSAGLNPKLKNTDCARQTWPGLSEF